MCDFVLALSLIVCFFFFCLFVFFFQAEDGIRYLVRSRGLGDVYKRQSQRLHVNGNMRLEGGLFLGSAENIYDGGSNTIATVSYTHLTLPTSDLV